MLFEGKGLPAISAAAWSEYVFSSDTKLNDAVLLVKIVSERYYPAMALNAKIVLLSLPNTKARNDC